MRKKAVPILMIFNGLLLLTGWILAFYAYPRLPQQIPLWPRFTQTMPPFVQKNLLFFLYPFLQTVLCGLIARLAYRKNRSESDREKHQIFQEYVYLNLIFINLIIIHYMRGLIFTAYQVGTGVGPVYYIGIILILLVLIPYYRIRLKLLSFDSGNKSPVSNS